MAACGYFRIRQLFICGKKTYDCYCLREHRIIRRMDHLVPHYREMVCRGCPYHMPSIREFPLSDECIKQSIQLSNTLKNHSKTRFDDLIE
jgi:hypothetical protein